MPLRKSGLLLISMQAVVLLCLAGPLAAKGASRSPRPVPRATPKERILSFDSRITVNLDASMRVVESIQVQATGNKIVHGIYRDFPTSYRDLAGTNYSVLFSIVSVERDGGSEPYHTDPIPGGVRVYFGDSDRTVSPGPHMYVLTYDTARQLGFFKDHDELYWNVTGTRWDFPIDVATATVVLPENIRDKVTSLDGDTGTEGSRDKNFTTAHDPDGNPTYSAQQLGPRQGLTLVVTWPKGLLAEPGLRQRAVWFLKDNRAVVVGAIGLVVILFYYLVAWIEVGRDPERGTIMPSYEPPDNLSPAAMRYLERMGFDDKAFTSAILDLAAKGSLSIDRDESRTYRLIRKEGTEEAEKKLSAEERVLAKKLFESGSPLILDQEKHMLLQRARKSLEFNLQARMEGAYFVTNARYLWPGVVLTVGLVAALAVMGSSGVGAAEALFMTVWLTFWTLGVSALLLGVYRAWKSVAATGSFGTAGAAVFLTLFSVPFLGGEAAGAYMLWKFGSPATFLMVVSALAINVLFHHLLKRPTYTGRKLLDRVDGFKMFLGAVDGKRLDTVMPPDKTPQLFERFLPYALALDVENKWAEQFSGVLATAAAASSSQGGYSPSWYTGTDVAAFTAASFTSSFGNSFSSAVSSASASPGSSSGSGGGGSSGGGGGGGGGGGW